MKKKSKTNIIVYLCFIINLIIFSIVFLNNEINSKGRMDLCDINEIEESRRNILSNGVYPNVKNQTLFNITKYLSEDIQGVVLGIIVITMILGIIFLLLEIFKYKRSIILNIILGIILILFGGYNFVLYSVGKCDYNEYDIECEYKCPKSLLNRENKYR